MGRNNTRQYTFVLVALLMVVLGQARPATAQDGSKDIGVVPSREVIDRPSSPSGGAAGATASAVKTQRTGTYRPSKRFSKVPPARTMEYAQLGLTIWRLQNAEGAKEFGQEGEEPQLEQMESGTALTIGSAVRIGIEPLTRNGYLYVVERERFADGTYGAARLIFPTLRTRNGNNSVKAHELVLIPRPPSYFRINPSSTGKAQTAEVLTIILSPMPLELPAPLGDQPISLSNAMFQSWETKWSAPVNTLELSGGAGAVTSVKTQTEGSKSFDQERQEAQQLTQEDPLPQTVYRATINRGQPLLVNVTLRFKLDKGKLTQLEQFLSHS